MSHQESPLVLRGYQRAKKTLLLPEHNPWLPPTECARRAERALRKKPIYQLNLQNPQKLLAVEGARSQNSF